MWINRGSRLLLTSLFQLEAEGRFAGHFITDYGRQGLEAVGNRRSYSSPSLGLPGTSGADVALRGGIRPVLLVALVVRTDRLLRIGLDHSVSLSPSETSHETGEEIWSLHP